jgi:hypothetical protein
LPRIESLRAKALAEVEPRGLLLLADARLPSVAALVAGEPVRGSWWAHPRGREIFAVSSWLAQRGDVLALRLVEGKVTFVGRELAPFVVAVGLARARWQTHGLSAAARRLLRAVDERGRVPCADAAASRAARDLAARLLAFVAQEHTESGRHALVAESWRAVAARMRVDVSAVDVELARAEVERAAAALSGRGPPPALPWTVRSATRTARRSAAARRGAATRPTPRRRT